MNETNRAKVLRIVLIVVGLIFVVGVWPLTMIWPSGWAWHTEGRSEYLEMITGIYATLGVFLLIASRDPLAHRSLIWFTVWSSIVHGGIMALHGSWTAKATPRRACSPQISSPCSVSHLPRSSSPSSRLAMA